MFHYMDTSASAFSGGMVHCEQKKNGVFYLKKHTSGNKLIISFLQYENGEFSGYIQFNNSHSKEFFEFTGNQIK